MWKGPVVAGPFYLGGGSGIAILLIGKGAWNLEHCG